MKNVEQTVISQYANSPTIMRLIQSLDVCIDPSADIDNFYDCIWNVDTALGFGLDIWGRIVGVSRNVQLPSTGNFFGFQGEGTGSTPFNQAPFYTRNAPSSDTYSFTDEAYRQLIMAKALANISENTIPAINHLLQNLLPGVRCYVVDLGGMAMEYKFDDPLTAVQYAIVSQTGILPRPAGVKSTVVLSS